MKVLKIMLLVIVFAFQSFTSDISFAANNINEDISDNLVCNNCYSGFKLISKKYIECIDSTMYQFEHEKTGAELCCIKNNDENKLFSLNFKIIPKDNTGVFHVIEHMISDQLKSLPAEQQAEFTRSTYSQYRSGTSDENEFEECINTTLNAAFFSKLDENVMRQEGWRYELDNVDDQLKINGVVYNEEKSRNSSPEVLLAPTIEASLYTNPNQFDEGGTAEDIPDLTYEELNDTYKEYYTPSNSMIYLYGNIDIMKILESINSRYFSKLNKSDSIKIPEKIDRDMTGAAYSESFYAIPEGSDTKRKTDFSLNYSLGKDVDIETEKELELLQNIISPYLRKAFSENDLGDLNWIGINPFCIPVIGADEEDKEKFKSVVNDTLQSIVNDGIDKESVRSVFNKYEIECSEKNSSPNRGGTFMGQIVNAWAEGHDLEKSVVLSYNIDEIKEKYEKDNRYFEELINKYLLNSAHSSLIAIKPKAGLDEEKNNKLKESLKKYKESLSLDQINEIINENKKLKSWQEERFNKADNTASLDKVNKNAEVIPSEVDEVNGIKVLKHDIYTSNLEYVNLYFDTAEIPQDKLMYLILLNRVINKVNTKNLTYDKLCSEEDKYIGELTFDMYFPQSMPINNDSYKNLVKLKVSMSTLNDNIQNSLNILNELIQYSDFSDKDNLRNIIKNLRSEIQNEINYNPQQYIESQSLSYNSDEDKYNNMEFMPFYYFICELDNNFDKQSDEIIKNLNYIKENVFCKNNLIASYTGNDTSYDNFIKCFKDFSSGQKDSSEGEQQYQFNYDIKNEAFITSSPTQCIVESGNYKKLGYNKNGKLNVLMDIIADYLGHEIRTKGGAYSLGAYLNDSDIYFFSNDDPNLNETIDIFKTIPSYLENFSADEDEMNHYILETLNTLDMSRLDAKEKGEQADNMYIAGVTQEDVQKYRNDILEVTSEDIRNYATLIASIIEQNNISVSGNADAINLNKGLFQKINNISADSFN